MTTLPPPGIKKFNDNSPEKKAYNLADSFYQYLPIQNDRNRLGFNIYRNLIGEGDTPEVIVKNGKYKLTGIEREDFIKLLTEEISKLKI
ncbi:MAG TPA: hypothetical protein PL041_04705 [Melioribacteraceae bacterium]|nr:hypothetical protein [Melioribacteraceae bacterium]